MRSNDFFVVFPEGDVQEIDSRLSVNEVVDLNGRPLAMPLTNPRVIAFRVAKVTVKEERNATATYHFLELLSIDELLPYVRR